MYHQYILSTKHISGGWHIIVIWWQFMKLWCWISLQWISSKHSCRVFLLYITGFCFSSVLIYLFWGEKIIAIYQTYFHQRSFSTIHSAGCGQRSGDAWALYMFLCSLSLTLKTIRVNTQRHPREPRPLLCPQNLHSPACGLNQTYWHAVY